MVGIGMADAARWGHGGTRESWRAIGRSDARAGLDASSAGCDPNAPGFPGWCNGWSDVTGEAPFTLLDADVLLVTPNAAVRRLRAV